VKTASRWRGTNREIIDTTLARCTSAVQGRGRWQSRPRPSLYEPCCNMRPAVATNTIRCSRVSQSLSAGNEPTEPKRARPARPAEESPTLGLSRPTFAIPRPSKEVVPRTSARRARDGALERPGVEPESSAPARPGRLPPTCTSAAEWAAAPLACCSRRVAIRSVG
jgi:hypothetical protein